MRTLILTFMGGMNHHLYVCACGSCTEFLRGMMRKLDWKALVESASTVCA